MADARRFIRENSVFIAAVALLGAMTVLFGLATAIPTWTVPPPQHDLVFRIENFESRPADVIVNFKVRDGRLEADLRPVPPAAVGVAHEQRWALLLFDHQSMAVREIPVEVPRSLPEGGTRTVVIDALAGRRVIPAGTAPDGYGISRMNTGAGGGIAGALFGVRPYRRGFAIARDGRTIELELPVPYRESYGKIFPIAWVIATRQR